MTNEKTKHWSGKPSDPEFQNYTKNAFAEVFKIEPVFEKGYPSYKAVNDIEKSNPMGYLSLRKEK